MGVAVPGDYRCRQSQLGPPVTIGVAGNHGPGSHRTVGIGRNEERAPGWYARL